MLQRFIPGIKRISDELKHDDDLDMDYRATRWSIRGRDVQITQDARGYHAKCGDRVSGALDEGGLVGWIMELLRR